MDGVGPSESRKRSSLLRLLLAYKYAPFKSTLIFLTTTKTSSTSMSQQLTPPDVNLYDPGKGTVDWELYSVGRQRYPDKLYQAIFEYHRVSAQRAWRGSSRE